MEIEMKVVGVMENLATHEPAVMLVSRKKHEPFSAHDVLPVSIGVFEACAIQLGIEKTKLPRPQTHDLLKNTIESLGASLKKAVITNLVDNTDHAVLYLESGGKTVTTDCRPSDAIALALRTNSPIFVESTVLEKNLQSLSEPSNEQVEKWFESLDADDLPKF